MAATGEERGYALGQRRVALKMLLQRLGQAPPVEAIEAHLQADPFKAQLRDFLQADLDAA